MESSYTYNPLNRTLTRSQQQPPDWKVSTYQTQELLLEGLSDWKFSYWDGVAWQSTWEETGQLPKTVKINFRFADETKEEEFVVNIPVSP